MNPKILFRKSQETEEEFRIAKKYFNVVEQRTHCNFDDIVFGRYSVLPFYNELEKDFNRIGCQLVNTYRQHKWIADFEYYDEVEPYTFETWFDLRDLPDDCQFVVKGKTNSRKARWNTHMFARDRREAILIATELMQDPMLQDQGIIVRRYEPLELLETGLNGQPFVNEHRLFYLGSKRIAHGFYWSQSEVQTVIDSEGLAFADRMAKLVKPYTGFFVLDVAKTAKGEWKLVEVNDAQMAGLSTIDPDSFYSSLSNEACKLWV